MIAGRAPSMAAGIAAAREVIDSGKGRAWLQRLQGFAANRAESQGAA